MSECKDPTCVFSLKNKKCVKPNPYIQYLPQCKKLNLPLATCKENYKLNIDDIKKNACNYYKDNIENKKDNKASCPKNRRPTNDSCPDNYPLLKNNKYNIKCCYKNKKVPIESNQSTGTKQSTRTKQSEDTKQSTGTIQSEDTKQLALIEIKKTPFKDIKMPNKDEYLNKRTKKYIRMLKKYQHKVNPVKINKI